uniref:CDKN1A interacting zinc finger protein 1 n=1 Tax=Caenorhabditis tropicalis TaxID=1561998 RepID=A0A1I7TPF9_9PELO
MQLLNGPQSPASNLPFGIQFPSGLGTFCVPQNLRLFPSLSSSAGAQQQNPFSKTFEFYSSFGSTSSSSWTVTTNSTGSTRDTGKKNSRDLKLQQQRAQGKDEDPRSPGQIGSIYVKNGTIRCVSTEDEEIDQLWKEKNKVRDKCQERSGL